MRQPRKTHFAKQRRNGISLVEAVISMVIVSVMIVAALRAVGSVARGQRVQTWQRHGPALARQLMSEILPCRYSDPDETPIFGPENSEGSSDRLDFDDVDDYHGWSSAPPESKDGTALSDMSGWSRTVTVEYVDPDDISIVIGTDEGLKRITITVADPLGRQTVLSSLRSIYGLYDHPLSVQKTYVSWVGIGLQIGIDSNGKVTSASNPFNRIDSEGQ